MVIAGSIYTLSNIFKRTSSYTSEKYKLLCLKVEVLAYTIKSSVFSEVHLVAVNIFFISEKSYPNSIKNLLFKIIENN